MIGLLSAPVDMSLSLPSVALGFNHVCAIVKLAGSDTVMCWGNNNGGQLGNGDVGISTSPMGVVGLPTGGTPVGIYANGNQTCALISFSGDSASTGYTPYCWGNNSNDELGTIPNVGTNMGDMVRIICGNNGTPVAGSPTPAFTPTNRGVFGSGFCSGVPAPTYTKGPGDSTIPQGLIYTLSGQSGIIGSQDSGDNADAHEALYASLIGITFDYYKNLIVSSGGFTSAAGYIYEDYSLRMIENIVVGPDNGVKYEVTDSNQKVRSSRSPPAAGSRRRARRQRPRRLPQAEGTAAGRTGSGFRRRRARRARASAGRQNGRPPRKSAGRPSAPAPGPAAG